MRWEKEVRIDQARNKPCSGIQTLSKYREILGVFIQEDDQICFWRAHQGYNEGEQIEDGQRGEVGGPEITSVVHTKDNDNWLLVQ